MEGMLGAIQVLAALLHGVQSIDTYDWEPVIRGSGPHANPSRKEKATTVFQLAFAPPIVVWPSACMPRRASLRQGEALMPRLSHTVAFLSSPSEPSTLPSTVLQEEAGDKDGDANPSDEAGDCLSNRPASSNTRPVSNDMLKENGEDISAMPPQGVDPQDDSSPSHSESPIKRRQGTKASAGRVLSQGPSHAIRASRRGTETPPRHDRN